MMKTVPAILLFLSVLTACVGTGTPLPVTSIPTGTMVIPTPELASVTPAAAESAEVPSATPMANDVFAQLGITLPAPREACIGLTQTQTEGPYYKADTPQRNSLFEEGMPGTRLILVGYVLDQDCQPLPNVWLDFWQADANGEYDNSGYRLRGHQFTDAQGRYYLETILPGLYSSRPIEHIHVKVRPEGGQEITSQLYFPQQPVDELTVTLENKGDYQLGYFNFVVQK
jgi:protocatechuate 3,4-dioxygenase beta subunit